VGKASGPSFCGYDFQKSRHMRVAIVSMRVLLSLVFISYIVINNNIDCCSTYSLITNSKIYAHFAKPFMEVKKEWQRAVDVDLSSVYNCCKAVGRQMLKKKYERIINISSCLAERGLINSSAYCASRKLNHR
jgi:NAD(P)-dependent dehydrogenase (short-subunit alcohol dehydrogenase family)